MRSRNGGGRKLRSEAGETDRRGERRNSSAQKLTSCSSRVCFSREVQALDRLCSGNGRWRELGNKE